MSFVKIDVSTLGFIIGVQGGIQDFSGRFINPDLGTKRPATGENSF